MNTQLEFESMLARIMQATGCHTQIQLAEILSIRQSSISDAKRRNSIPSEWLLKLYMRLGVNPDWIETGQGLMHLKDPALFSFQNTQAVQKLDCKCIPAKRLPAQDGERALDYVIVPASFARPGIQTFKIDGTSMEPQIMRGAFVGVDTEQTGVISGEVYAVNVPGEGVVIRRLFLDSPNSRLTLSCQNKTHLEYSLALPLALERVLGRVVWVFQEI